MNKILIIEDDEAISEMMRMCLAKNGYGCAIAKDGLIATELIEGSHFDLILLDIMLPKIDGYELLEYIKQYEIQKNYNNRGYRRGHNGCICIQ